MRQTFMSLLDTNSLHNKKLTLFVEKRTGLLNLSLRLISNDILIGVQRQLKMYS
jgi:hypothetical protein